MGRGLHHCHLKVWQQLSAALREVQGLMQPVCRSSHGPCTRPPSLQDQHAELSLTAPQARAKQHYAARSGTVCWVVQAPLGG